MGNEAGLHSWAVPDGMPTPGNKVLAIRQPMHSHSYLGWEGSIPAGQYGGGTVKSIDRGKVHVTKAEADKLQFIVAHKKYPEYFTMIRTGDRPDHKQEPWLLMNNTPTDPGKMLGDPDVFQKLKLKSTPADDAEGVLSQLDDKGMVEGKANGASILAKINKHSVDIVSYRTSAVGGKPIVHTHRFWGTKPQDLDIPDEHVGKILRGELLATRDGEPLPPQALGPLLNSSLDKSLADQKAKNIALKVSLFGVAGKEGEAMEPLDRHNELMDILQHLPRNKFDRPPVAVGPEAGKALWDQVKHGHHPSIDEGIVVYQPGKIPTKIKLRPSQDVIIRKVYPGEKGLKYESTAGGFSYSLPGSDKIVGKVGTGFDDEFRSWLWQNQNDIIGRRAKIEASQHLPSGAYFQPSFIHLHEDYNREL